MRRILVVKLASLGDLLTATPALRALRDSFPSAHIAVLTTPASAPALRGLDSVDEVLSFDKFAYDRPAGLARGLTGAFALANRLRAGTWDVLLLLHHLTTPFGLAKYAALCLSSGAPVRAGLDNGRGRWFLTHRAPDHGFGWKHEADYWLDVAETVGAQRPAEPRLELCIGPEDEAWAAARWAELLARSEGTGTALLVPGSGSFSLARRWHPERFVEVGQRLQAERGLAPLVLAGTEPDELALAERISADIGRAAQIAPAAPTPQALGALIRRCEVVIANDSGPVHLAAAVGTPVVAIFGPTNHRAWGPYPPGEQRNQVVREQVACQPCIHRGHDFGTPQGCPARTCLALVQPDAVMKALDGAGVGSEANFGPEGRASTGSARTVKRESRSW